MKNEKTPAEVNRTCCAKTTIKLIVAGFAIASIALLVFGCTPKRQEVATYWGNTPTQAFMASSLQAKEIDGKVYLVAPTGSMEPFITGGDYIVVKSIPYADVSVGMIATYQASWRPKDSPPVAHWVAEKLGDSWIMDGQSNKSYEGKGQTMGVKEFTGIVVAIYTTRDKK